MNPEESFRRFVVGVLDLKWIDYEHLKTMMIDDYVNDWVQSDYVVITKWEQHKHQIKLTDLGKSIVLMRRL